MKNIKWIAVVVVYIAFAKANTLHAQQEFKAIANFVVQTKFDVKKDTTNAAEKAKSQDPEMAALRAKLNEALAKGNKKEYEMEFTASESTYDEVKELAKPKANTGMSVSFSINNGSTSKVFKDLKEQKYYKEDQIMGKDFLIIDDIKTYNWQLTNETKMIGKYTCFKATYTPELTEEEKKEAKEKAEAAENGSLFGMIPEKDRTITAWWTPEISVSNGPGEYQGLPGFILEVKERNTILLCTKIEINPEEDLDLKKPRSGKEINQEDFDALRKKKHEERMENNGGKSFFIETRSN